MKTFSHLSKVFSDFPNMYIAKYRVPCFFKKIVTRLDSLYFFQFINQFVYRLLI